ncbi:hypothetical protein ACFLZP_01285 [Patescibacteria group bacterium]
MNDLSQNIFFRGKSLPKQPDRVDQIQETTIITDLVREGISPERQRQIERKEVTFVGWRCHIPDCDWKLPPETELHQAQRQYAQHSRDDHLTGNTGMTRRYQRNEQDSSPTPDSSPGTDAAKEFLGLK